MNIVEGSFAGLAGEEIETLRKLLSGATGQALEIGCMDGYSTAHILEMCQMRVTTIDPFIPDSMAENLIGSRERFWQNVAPWKDRVELIEDYSFNVAGQWDRLIDFLFIDGDHSYMAVLRDFEQWTRFLPVGGVLAMHDSRMGRPWGPKFHTGPSMVARDNVYARQDKWEVIGEAFSLTVAKKRRE